MKKVLILGAGTIGQLIATLLAATKEYRIYLADLENQIQNNPLLRQLPSEIQKIVLDARDLKRTVDVMKEANIDAVISALPYFCNAIVAEAALEAGVHYFDLTEDVEVTNHVAMIAAKSSKAFVPQCGLAPGFISIVASDLMKKFERLESVHLRVGALPINPNNALKYSLTWSTDGLINEYGNPCSAIVHGEMTTVQPLEGHEEVEIDGLQYEAFNTSGGLGSLAETYKGAVVNMNYKTLRYPGHCKQMRLLMNDLKLNEDRDTLKRILENSIPKTTQDVVIVYVSVTGMRDGQLYSETFVKKIYQQEIQGRQWSAIQVTTASSICAVADMVITSKKSMKGLVRQESFALDDFLDNRFGQYYT